MTAKTEKTPKLLVEAPLEQMGGSKSDAWNNILANQALKTMWIAHSDDENRAAQIKATVAGLMGIAPRDEIEGMFAAQLVGVHNASMECLRRAMLQDQTFEGRQTALTQANKLSRTYATLVEALNRHRGKGQQKVTVEHVHVHSGGQAVVGDVHHGGGVPRDREDRPHAKQVAHAPGATLQGHFEEKPEAMPVARR